jgi:hypothetical protein
MNNAANCTTEDVSLEYSDFIFTGEGKQVIELLTFEGEDNLFSEFSKELDKAIAKAYSPAPVIVPLERRVMPTHIAMEIIGVSPMCAPSPEFMAEIKRIREAKKTDE